MNKLALSLMVAMAATLPSWMVACAALPAGSGGAGGAHTATGTLTGTGNAGGTETSTGTPTAGTGGGTQTITGAQEACPPDLAPPCMLYHIPLLGNPSFDIPLRNKYIAAFGDACYMSDSDPSTFNCFYQKWQAACADAVKIAEVFGAAPYDKTYACQPIPGTKDYSLQIGPDVANKITINYQPAPRQTPLTDINGVPTAVNGLYRNLTDPAGVGPGQDFKGNSGVSNGDGGFLEQREWVLQVNRNANDGGIRSDLAGFKWPCKGSDGGLTECTEPEELVDPEKSDAGLSWEPVAQVHHVVPRGDKRCCAWGTNSYKNAAVISAKLNNYFTNNNPPAAEVKQLNEAKAY